ncbi:PapD-like protein [Mucor mucedo]|uniref:PapD-like protein n=1 Tax=Mucor mucedo TaxID=29922 RepID=UPI0022201BE3|nr:PapD-like protein [Mucor mucedo]KAI7897035.1 PapD-like protein [Mucor mucedo]
MSIKLDLENSISFERPLTRVVKKNIRIENPHDTPLAFKVKTTAPKLYCVRPNSDIIPPRGIAEVQIMLQALKEEPALDAKCKDKFLILSTLVEGPLTTMNVTDLWNYVEREQKGSIKERKLRCTYSLPGQPSAAPSAPVVAAATTTAAAAAPAVKQTPKETEDEIKMREMEREISKYKKELETLREPTVVHEKVIVQTNSFPYGVIILFALLALAVAYFLNK